MPFRVKFEIYEPGKSSPAFTTHDRDLARAEYNERFRKAPWTRLLFTIERNNLTKAEEYVFLVYEVRKAIRKFYNNGRNREDLKASLAKEAKLDHWNARTRIYMANHPDCQGDEKAKEFFLLVDSWREKWHKFFACKQAHTKDKASLDKLKEECLTLEKKIDKYIKRTIGLL